VVSRWTRPAISAHVATATRTDGRRPTDAALETLKRGRLEVLGRLVDASNATFLCTVDADTRAVYKPIRGERPLDDFPSRTLANREVAAYLLSEATGWGVVPPTVKRDGPFGPGMVQQWVEVDDAVDVLALVVADDPRLRRICIFDILANNADRKGGHLLPVAGGHIYGVDHGICFSADPKLRTVLWGWRGTELEDGELAVVESVCNELHTALGRSLAELLSADEVAATARRASRLAAAGRFPQPDPGRPALPWPPF
jgi:uncharacterized repeat protein (TIGR03843 family)